MSVVPVAVARILKCIEGWRMEEEFNWHNLDGLKLRNCKATVADGEFMVRMIMPAVVLEQFKPCSKAVSAILAKAFARSF